MCEKSATLTRIKIETIVHGHYENVFADFDRKLFEYLLPPFLKLKQYDGSSPGSRIHLSSTNGWQWLGQITEECEYENGKYFTDIGTELFPPLKVWKHTHRVEKYTDNKSMIIDEIRYSCGNTLVDILVFPVLYGQFAMRKPQYKKYFAQRYA